RSIVLHFALIATVISGGVFAFSGSADQLHSVTNGRSLAMLLGMGFLGTVGQIALTRAFALGDPSKVSVVGLSEVLFGAAYDYIVWKRTFGWVTLAGMAL